MLSSRLHLIGYVQHHLIGEEQHRLIGKKQHHCGVNRFACPHQLSETDFFFMVYLYVHNCPFFRTVRLCSCTISSVLTDLHPVCGDAPFYDSFVYDDDCDYILGIYCNFLCVHISLQQVLSHSQVLYAFYETR